MVGRAQCGISLGMDENTPFGILNKGRCKWGWDLSGGECMLRSLNGGRRCDGALPNRTVGDMRWGAWAFGWLRRRMVAWFLAFVDASVEKPGTEVAPKPTEPRTLPFHKTIDCLAPTTPDPTFFSFPRQHRTDSRTSHGGQSSWRNAAQDCLPHPNVRPQTFQQVRSRFALRFPSPSVSQRNERIFLRGQ